jgi:hypothetical protein
MVAGELTTESFRLRASISGSSRGFDEAEVAIWARDSAKMMKEGQSLNWFIYKCVLFSLPTYCERCSSCWCTWPKFHFIPMMFIVIGLGWRRRMRWVERESSGDSVGDMKIIIIELCILTSFNIILILFVFGKVIEKIVMEKAFYIMQKVKHCWLSYYFDCK